MTALIQGVPINHVPRVRGDEREACFRGQARRLPISASRGFCERGFPSCKRLEAAPQTLCSPPQPTGDLAVSLGEIGNSLPELSTSPEEIPNPLPDLGISSGEIGIFFGELPIFLREIGSSFFRPSQGVSSFSDYLPSQGRIAPSKRRFFRLFVFWRLDDNA